MDIEALMQNINSQVDHARKEKEEAKQREAARASRVRIQVSEEKREESRQALKQSLPKGTSIAFRVDNPVLLRSIISSIAGIAGSSDEDQAVLHFSKDGLSFRQMDPSHISLLDIAVPDRAFYNYVYEGSGTTTIGVSMKDLLAFSKITNLQDALTIRVSDDYLLAEIVNGTTRQHKVELQEPWSTKDPALPNIELLARATVDKYALNKVLRECELAGEDQVIISVSPKSIAFKGVTSGSQGSSEVIWPRGSAEVLDLLCDEPQRATYTISYIRDLLKSAVADTVQLQLSTKKPLRMELPLADPRSDARIVFWLAPRVSDPESDEGPKPVAATEQAPTAVPETKSAPEQSQPQAQETKPEPTKPTKSTTATRKKK